MSSLNFIWRNIENGGIRLSKFWRMTFTCGGRYNKSMGFCHWWSYLQYRLVLLSRNWANVERRISKRLLRSYSWHRTLWNQLWCGSRWILHIWKGKSILTSWKFRILTQGWRLFLRRRSFIRATTYCKRQLGRKRRPKPTFWLIMDSCWSQMFLSFRLWRHLLRCVWIESRGE